MTKCLLVSGGRSGCGKTSLTLGLLAALARRGLAVAPFKTGPDFIDPGLHGLASGQVSHNLDSWMLSPTACREIFARYALGASCGPAASGEVTAWTSAGHAVACARPEATSRPRQAAASAPSEATPRTRPADPVDRPDASPRPRPVGPAAWSEATARLSDPTARLSDPAARLEALPRPADLALVEGAMGLFDGASGTDERGSAAHMAKLLGIPVLLVLDASGMGRSLAAAAQGFARFDKDLTLAGVVANRVASPSHRDILGEALAAANVPLLGCLFRRPELSLPSRHLGLVTADDVDVGPDWLERLADWVEEGLDLDRLLAALPEWPGDRGRGWQEPDAPSLSAASPGRARLGVARDRAFCFLYGENLRLLRQAGADLIFFSPLADAELPSGLDGLYLPGGYPELHAQTLSANRTMLDALRAFSLSGRPVWAECGGFMTLMEAIEDREGSVWPMAGVFTCRARMGSRFAALGYREARTLAPSPLGPAGTVARGHEFHYSSLIVPPDVPGIFALTGRTGELPGPEGFLVCNTLGSYVHLHLGSNPELAANLVRAMREAG